MSDPYVERARAISYFIGRLDAAQNVIARLSPAMNHELEAQAALESYRASAQPHHAEAVLCRDTTIRAVRS